ncbi:MAG: MMPL family transporter [Myxococcales bacterium]|nr:MMPL family transporter [Myxococcales bacterium]
MNAGLRSALTRLVEVSVTRPWVPLALAGLVGAAALGMSSRLEFRGDFIELLPAKAPEVQDMRFVEKKAGGGGYLVVQVTGGDQKTRRAFADAFAPRFEKEADLVRYVEYHFDVQFFRDRGLLVLPPDRLAALRDDLQKRIRYEKAIANPLYVDLGEEEPPLDFTQIEKKYSGDAPASEYVESQDGQELYLYVKPTQLAGDLDFNKKLIARAKVVSQEELAAFPGLKIQFTGAYVIRVEEDEVMQADLARAALIATLVSFGIILLASRRLVALVVVAAPVSLGIACTFAFTWVLVGHLNPITGFLGAILIGLGIEYGVHLSMRYWEERASHAPREAMLEAVLGTFTGALTSAATNSAAFAVLVFADFDAFRQFGKIAAFGVMSTVLAAYLVGPAILLLAERLPGLKRLLTKTAAAHEAGAPADPPGKPAPRPIPSPVLIGILVAVLGAAGYSASVANTVGFETNLRKLKGESPATDLDDHITRQLGLIMTPALAWVPDLDSARKVAEAAREVNQAAGERHSFAKVASLNDLIPWDADKRLPIIAQIRKLAEDLPKSLTEGEKGEKVRQLLAQADAKPWGVDELPLEIRRRFMAQEGGGTFVLIFPRYSGYDVDELKLWARDLSEVVRRAKDKGAETHILDGNRIAERIVFLIRKDGPTIMALAAVVVFLMIWLSLRSFVRAWLVAGPLYLGMACVLGAMHLFHVNLNFLNVVVLPNLLAIAVDNSVHLFHRYREEGPGSLGHIMRTTGFAAVVATLSNAAGYGAMLIAHHEGLRSVGVLAVLGVTCTFLGTTIFFPALLAMIERWRRAQVDAGTET